MSLGVRGDVQVAGSSKGKRLTQQPTRSPETLRSHNIYDYLCPSHQLTAATQKPGKRQKPKGATPDTHGASVGTGVQGGRGEALAEEVTMEIAAPPGPTRRQAHTALTEALKQRAEDPTMSPPPHKPPAGASSSHFVEAAGRPESNVSEMHMKMELAFKQDTGTVFNDATGPPGPSLSPVSSSVSTKSKICMRAGNAWRDGAYNVVYASVPSRLPEDTAACLGALQGQCKGSGVDEWEVVAAVKPPASEAALPEMDAKLFVEDATVTPASPAPLQLEPYCLRTTLGKPVAGLGPAAAADAEALATPDYHWHYFLTSDSVDQLLEAGSCGQNLFASGNGDERYESSEESFGAQPTQVLQEAPPAKEGFEAPQLFPATAVVATNKVGPCATRATEPPSLPASQPTVSAGLVGHTRHTSVTSSEHEGSPVSSLKRAVERVAGSQPMAHAEVACSPAPTPPAAPVAQHAAAAFPQAGSAWSRPLISKPTSHHRPFRAVPCAPANAAEPEAALQPCGNASSAAQTPQRDETLAAAGGGGNTLLSRRAAAVAAADRMLDPQTAELRAAVRCKMWETKDWVYHEVTDKWPAKAFTLDEHFEGLRLLLETAEASMVYALSVYHRRGDAARGNITLAVVMLHDCLLCDLKEYKCLNPWRCAALRCCPRQ
jgi:hypothetical protein